MSKQSDNGISWTNETWNVVTGCTPISEGCANCYAARYAKRGIGDFRTMDTGHGDTEEPIIKRRPFSEVRTHPDRLDKPLRWKKPRMVFVCSMGDLFYEAVNDTFIMAVFGVMAAARNCTFQVLTKRPQRMFKWFEMMASSTAEVFSKGPFPPMRPASHHYLTQVVGFAEEIIGRLIIPQEEEETIETPWPLPNVWLGVSAENQARADERIPILFQTPAAVRFVSIEPLLRAVDLRAVKIGCGYDSLSCACSPDSCNHPKVDWVIVGAESGPKFRECKIEWVEDIVEQCQSANVPVHVKQLHINGKLSKNMADWPEHLRVREWPGGMRA